MEKKSTPWFGLWVRPRKAFQAILDTHPLRTIIWLAIIGGVTSALAMFSTTWSEQRNLVGVVSLLVVGAIWGLIHLFLGGWFYQFSGRWIGGKGSYRDVKCAVGWSYYPYILANFLFLITLFMIPEQWVWVQTILLAIVSIVYVWGIIMFIKMIAQAHKYSSWHAVGGIIIAMILLALLYAVVFSGLAFLGYQFTN